MVLAASLPSELQVEYWQSQRESLWLGKGSCWAGKEDAYHKLREEKMEGGYGDEAVSHQKLEPLTEVVSPTGFSVVLGCGGIQESFTRTRKPSQKEGAQGRWSSRQGLSPGYL